MQTINRYNAGPTFLYLIYFVITERVDRRQIFLSHRNFSARFLSSPGEGKRDMYIRIDGINLLPRTLHGHSRNSLETNPLFRHLIVPQVINVPPVRGSTPTSETCLPHRRDSADAEEAVAAAAVIDRCSSRVMRRRVSHGKTRGAGRSAGRGAVAVGGVRQSGRVTTSEYDRVRVAFVKTPSSSSWVRRGEEPLQKGRSTRR